MQRWVTGLFNSLYSPNLIPIPSPFYSLPALPPPPPSKGIAKSLSQGQELFFENEENKYTV